MKKIKWALFVIFAALSAFLFLRMQDITFKPWLTEQPLDYPGYASGNGELTAIIADSSRTIAVINNKGELVYKLHAGNPSRAFVSAELVELDGQNNLYVYDRQFGGVHEDSIERILKYSPKGEFLGVVYEYIYKNDDFITTKGKISGMASYGTSLFLVRLEHEGFYIEYVYTDMSNESRTHAFFPRPDAFQDFSYCRINTKNLRIDWTTKTGNILRYNLSGSLVDEIITGSASYPFMTASDDDDNLIYTDVIHGEVVSFNHQTGEKTILHDSSMPGAGLYYYINSRNNTTYASHNGQDILIINKDKEHIIINSWLWPEKSVMIRYALFVICIADAILFLILLIQFVLFLLKLKTSAVFKQILLFGTCIIFGAGISSVIIIGEMQKRYTENTYNELENISRLISASVDISVIGRLESRAQYDEAEYRALAEHIRSVFSELQFEGKQVYLIIWMERNGIVYSMYDLESAWGIFYPYGKYENSFLEYVYNEAVYEHSKVSDSSGTWVTVSGPMYDKDGNIAAAIEAGYNIQTVEKENRDMMLQVALIVLATTVAFLLIVIECLLLFDAYRKNKNEITKSGNAELKPNILKYIIALLMKAYKKDNNTNIANVSSKQSGKVINHLINTYKAGSTTSFHPELLRAAAFFMFFSANFATALLPMYAAGLYIPVLNLPREFVVTLPFTVQVIFMIAALLLVPLFLGKAGVRKISMVSALLFVAGNILCIAAEDIVILSLGYGFMGFSCGAFGLIFNTIIGSQTNATDMNSGFAHYNASYLAGVNVGVVFGAIIAQFFPYRTVFWFSSAISLLFLVIIIFSLRSNLFNHYYNVQYAGGNEKNAKKFALIKFIFRPVVLCVLFLALMPFVVSVSFTEYFLPIFGTDNGLGEANIGQLMLLSGLFAILFSASLCQLVSKRVPIFFAVIVPLLIDAAAIYLFSTNVSVSMLIVTVILLAFVNIFAFANIQTYFTILFQNNKISSVKALGTFSVVENMSMAIGPIVFSYILANNIAFGMKIFAGAILGCVIIFAVVSNISVRWNYKTLDEISEEDNREDIRAGITTNWQE